MNRRSLLGAGIGSVAALSLPRMAQASDVERALDAVGDARFIAIGERHDNPAHHRLQAELVAALRPAGLAFEMIPQEEETMVGDMRAAGHAVSEIGAALGWASSGWPDWSHYAPLLEAAPDAYIAGGGLSKATLGQIYASGASGLGEELTARYGLDAALPEDVTAQMLDEQYAAHCEMLPREKLGAMIEVQRAWDASYAEAWRRASREGGGRAVLICGNAHARLDRGAPAYLARAEPGAVIASVGMLEEGDAAPDDVYTTTLSAPAPAREDPCEKMREAMQKG